MSKKPIVYIIYSYKDIEITKQVVNFLENECNQSIWLEKREIKLNDFILEQMDEELSSSSYILVLSSESFPIYRWLQREWLASLANKSIVLIPVLIAPNMELTALLRDYLYVDLSSGFQSGLAQLKSFFKEEFNKIETRSTEDRRGPIAIEQVSLLKGASRREIRLVTQRCMDETKFRAFLFDAEIEPSEIAGDSLNLRLLNLLHRKNSEGDLGFFTAWLNTEMPDCVKHQLQKLRNF